MSHNDDTSAVAAAELETLIREGVPLVGSYGVTVESVGAGTIRLRMPYREDFIRPGGTVTGPALFGLADVALYGAVLSLIGRVELAVTTSMTSISSASPGKRASSPKRAS